ncbi:unnamed protein product [Phytophthora fragariaefolia]|uniref:Unnamed protein product n=1 Tax=Phytophthora fragariaefolia TaxID=1490495 RepID=A0A9W6U437_9STRA|nr:unnamed protein product [Phytophthora fragariaefolia]
MTSLARAPIWKSYLAIRSPSASEATSVVDQAKKSNSNSNSRSRKRAKPSSSRGGANGPAAAIWMTLATPLATTRRSGHGDREDGAAVLGSIRQYWEQLSVNERQQILFLDEPELVKQLYKLNLSLLCVGLMQRHLKTTNRTTTDTPTTNKKSTVAASNTTVAASSKDVAPVNVAGVQERVITPSQTRAVTDTSSEKTYELLEAMEFMDIGTGGYVSHLEREAAQQMEQLLLEVSLEDKAMNHSTTASSSTSQTKKKTKKKRKKRAAVVLAQQPSGAEFTISHSKNEPEADSPCGHETIPLPSDMVLEEDSAPEPMPEPTSPRLGSDCRSDSSTASLDEAILDAEEVAPTETELPPKKISGLNPNALVFQPQEAFPKAEDLNTGTAFGVKRKFDEYIVSVPLEDVVSEASNGFENRSTDGESDDEEVIESVHDREPHRWRKQRRREEDAELEWQLQQVYAATSSLFGWDFTRQCDLPASGANLAWSESTLWRTAPKEVVRYFSPGNGDAYSRLQAPQFLPAPSGPPPSRYYFNPGPPMPFGPPLLSPPGMEPMPPHLHGNFGFQSADLPLVVSSPDFSSAQFHPSNHEDQVDV